VAAPKSRQWISENPFFSASTIQISIKYDYTMPNTFWAHMLTTKYCIIRQCFGVSKIKSKTDYKKEERDGERERKKGAP